MVHNENEERPHHDPKAAKPEETSGGQHYYFSHRNMIICSRAELSELLNLIINKVLDQYKNFD